MLPALIIAVVLLLIANLYYTLASKRSKAHRALDHMTSPLRKRENLLERILSNFPDSWPVDRNWLNEIYQRSRRETEDDCPDAEKVQLELEVQKDIDELFRTLDNDPLVRTDKRFRELRDGCEEVDGEIRMAAGTYNRKVREYNDALNEFPNRILAKVVKIQGLKVLEFPD